MCIEQKKKNMVYKVVKIWFDQKSQEKEIAHDKNEIQVIQIDCHESNSAKAFAVISFSFHYICMNQYS